MEQPVVFIVDDDKSVCRSLRRLMKSVGYSVRTFTSASEFLNQGCYRKTGCLLLDVRMPGMGGLELQERLLEAHSVMPIIFMSAHEDPQDRQKAMGAGALGFLRKPFEDQVLIDAVNSAMGRFRGSGQLDS
jgi:FixJ family two-component response regulator